MISLYNRIVYIPSRFDSLKYIELKIKSPILLHWKKESLIDKIKGIFK